MMYKRKPKKETECNRRQKMAEQAVEELDHEELQEIVTFALQDLGSFKRLGEILKKVDNK